MSYRTVSVDIYWKDDPDLLHPVRIAVGDVAESLKQHPKFDDDIFFYVKNDVELAYLYDPENGEDFVIRN